jgi:hypothetical protein
MDHEINLRNQDVRSYYYIYIYITSIFRMDLESSHSSIRVLVHKFTLPFIPACVLRHRICGILP